MRVFMFDFGDGCHIATINYMNILQTCFLYVDAIYKFVLAYYANAYNKKSSSYSSYPNGRW